MWMDSGRRLWLGEEAGASGPQRRSHRTSTKGRREAERATEWPRGTGSPGR